MHQIAPHQPDLRLVYLSNWVPQIDGLVFNNNDLASIAFHWTWTPALVRTFRALFWKKLSLLEAAEWRSGHSLVGPHRDDWAFYLGSQALQGHGSQGEVRSALLALKLCEIDLFRIETGHRPLFLLDDFSSELDRERRSFLLKYSGGIGSSNVCHDDGRFVALSERRFRVSARKFRSDVANRISKTHRAVTSSDYSADKIKILEGLEAVRKRPGMYIGDTGIARSASPASTRSSITRSTKRSRATQEHQCHHPCRQQRHRRRRRPRHPGRHARSAAFRRVEVVMTKLHAGGKFNEEGGAYKVSGGLHGVGAAS